MEDYRNNKYTSNFQEQVNDQRNAAPSDDKKERVGCHWENFFAISAIFRMFFLLFAATGVVASAVSKNQDDNGYFTGYASLRIAFLVFSCAIFAYEAVILVLDITNVFNTPKMRRCPINIFILIIDCLLFFGIIICSIFAFTKAKYMAQDIVTTPYGPIVAANYFKADAFYVMSIVGYLMSMLFVEEIVYLIFQILAKFLADRKSKKKSYSSYYPQQY